MTPDTCPHCGAPVRTIIAMGREFTCMTTFIGRSATVTQSPECARYVRTRISQLKRMADHAIPMMVVRAYNFARDCDGGFRYVTPKRSEAIRERANRFRAACLREIDRLRGGA